MKNVKQNCSDDLRSISTVIIVVGVIVSLILSIGSVVILKNITECGIFVLVIAFVLTLCVTFFLYWIIATVYQALSDLVKYTAQNATYLEHIDRLLSKQADEEPCGELKEIYAVSSSKYDYVGSKKKEDSSVKHSNAPITCPVCGTVNQAGTTLCTTCGHNLKH